MTSEARACSAAFLPGYPDRARRTYESHPARANWATKVGYNLLRRNGFRTR